MVEPAANERAAALIPRLFAILTAKLEDGAEIAVGGQASGQPLVQISEAAGRMADLGHEIAALAEAIRLLMQVGTVELMIDELPAQGAQSLGIVDKA